MDNINKINIVINNINNILKTSTTYTFVNSFSCVQMRKHKNGISINNALLYDFLYTNPINTRSKVCSIINKINNTEFARQSYDSKKDNISVNVYKSIFQDLKNIYSDLLQSKKAQNNDQLNIIAIDGVKNNNNKHKVVANMGYFDVTKCVPIDITYHGTKNPNIEMVSHTQVCNPAQAVESKKFIKDNINIFNKCIIFYL